MSSVVLDASAILTMFYEEPGADVVAALIQGERGEPLVSSINLCEVHTRLLRDGLSREESSNLLEASGLTVVHFTELDSYNAASLYEHTRKYGLSLGDRACLALGISRNGKVFTADRVWQQLKIGVEIELIRP